MSTPGLMRQKRSREAYSPGGQVVRDGARHSVHPENHDDDARTLPGGGFGQIGGVLPSAVEISIFAHGALSMETSALLAAAGQAAAAAWLAEPG